MTRVKKRRKPCPVKCPCLCHDGFGGAHPNQDCRDARDDGFGGGYDPALEAAR